MHAPCLYYFLKRHYDSTRPCALFGRRKMEETTVSLKLSPVLPILDSYVHATLKCVFVILLGKIKPTDQRTYQEPTSYIIGFFLSKQLKSFK